MHQVQKLVTDTAGNVKAAWIMAVADTDRIDHVASVPLTTTTANLPPAITVATVAGTNINPTKRTRETTRFVGNRSGNLTKKKTRTFVSG